MIDYQAARKLIVQTAQELVRKGYLKATGGNISVRIAENSALAVTPSNFDYMKMTPDDVCILDFEANQLEGPHKPSVEAGMHGAIYQDTRGCERHHSYPPGVHQRTHLN